MTWFSVKQHGLLDTINRYPTEWWLVYKDTDRPFWWNRWLKPGYRHVCAYRRDGRLWIACRPDGGFVDIHALRTDALPWESEPYTAVQRVCVMRAANYLRARFFIGPLTCVEAVTALLGISSWRVRTPWQLHRYVRRLYAQPNNSRSDRRGNAPQKFSDRSARQAG